MKKLLFIVVITFFCFTGFAKTIDFSFKDKDILKVISAYSNATNKKFIVDPNVRGKISILFPEKVTTEEAFNALSTSLALNGLAIIKEGDYFRVLQARSAQRGNLVVTEDLPTEQPVRIVTYIYKFKKRKALEVYKNIRLLSSKDGELSVDPLTNQLIMSDWTNNILRAHAIIIKLDKK